MRWKSPAGVVALAAGALVIGALFGQAGSGRAAGTTAVTNTGTPTISGTAQEGETLTADNGTWSGNPTTYAQAWSRCDKNGNKCSTIEEATSSTYTLDTPDVGHTLRVTVTATNADNESGSATSVPTAVVSSAKAPQNTAPPTVSGTTEVGSALTTSNGTWSNSPTKYTYAWERCDEHGNKCSTISGAVSATYTLTTADVGTTLRAAVTASNGTGSTTATSVPTAIVPPVVEGCPAGKGTIQIVDLTPPARLAIGDQSINPSPVKRSATSIALHFRVTACGGRPVQGASVFAVSIPYNQFKGTTGTTGADGTVTLTEPEQKFPVARRQELLVVLVRATKPGETLVAGVSTRRVVSFPVAH